MTQNPSDPLKPKVHAADALDALVADARAGNRPTGYQPIDFNNPNAVAAPRPLEDGAAPIVPSPSGTEDAPSQPADPAAPQADLHAAPADPGFAGGFAAAVSPPRPMTTAPPRRKHQLGEFWRHLVVPMAIGAGLMLLIGLWSAYTLATTHSRLKKQQAVICVAALPVGLVLLAGALIVKLDLARQDRVRRKQQAAAVPPPDFAESQEFATGPHPGFTPPSPQFAEPAVPPAWQMPAVPAPPPLPPQAQVPPPPYYAPPPAPPQSEPPTIT